MTKPKSKVVTLSEQLLLDVDATCMDLGNISRTTLYAEMKAGELDWVEIGDRRFTTREQRLDYIERKRRRESAA
jgi:hypothetical protein